jgi:hypothetical protein
MAFLKSSVRAIRGHTEQRNYEAGKFRRTIMIMKKIERWREVEDALIPELKTIDQRKFPKVRGIVNALSRRRNFRVIEGGLDQSRPNTLKGNYTL